MLAIWRVVLNVQTEGRNNGSEWTNGKRGRNTETVALEEATFEESDPRASVLALPTSVALFLFISCLHVYPDDGGSMFLRNVCRHLWYKASTLFIPWTYSRTPSYHRFYICLTSALAAGESSASRPCRFTPGERVPGTHWIGGWVDPRNGLDDMEGREFLTLPGLELRSLGRPARSQSLYRLRYPPYAFMAQCLSTGIILPYLIYDRLNRESRN
jgi:hypothetical protein